jgi:hypothetical protein
MKICVNGKYKVDYCIIKLSIFLVIVCTIGVVICGITLSSYNFDTWMFYDISLDVFSDFYRIWTYRSYFTPLPYSASTPPLYPTAIAVIDRLLGLGHASGILINLFAFAGLVWCSTEITKTLSGRRSDGLVLMLAMLCFLPFVNEVYGARTHPLALMIFAVLFLVAIRNERLDPKSGAWLGLLSGLAVMTRFDWLLPSLILGGLLVYWSRRLTIAIIYLLCLLLTVLPWIAYSILRFGILYASDSTWVASAAAPGWWSSDYFAPPGPPRIDGAAALIAKLWGNSPVLAEFAGDLARHIAPLLFGFVVGGIGYLAIFRSLPKFEASPLPFRFRRGLTLLLVWVGVIISAWMTGYESIRYLSGLVWQSVIIGGSALSLWFSPLGSRTRDRCAIIFGASFAVLGIGLSIYLSTAGHGTPRAVVFSRSNALADCLVSAGGRPNQTVLFIDDELFPVEFGPIARWSAAVPPSNLQRLSAGDLASLLLRFRVRFVVGENSARLDQVAPYLRGAPVTGCPVTVHVVSLAAEP